MRLVTKTCFPPCKNWGPFVAHVPKSGRSWLDTRPHQLPSWSSSHSACPQLICRANGKALHKQRQPTKRRRGEHQPAQSNKRQELVTSWNEKWGGVRSGACLTSLPTGTQSSESKRRVTLTHLSSVCPAGRPNLQTPSLLRQEKTRQLSPPRTRRYNNDKKK